MNKILEEQVVDQLQEKKGVGLKPGDILSTTSLISERERNQQKEEI